MRKLIHKIVLVVELNGRKIPLALSAREYARFEQATPRDCSVPEFLADAVRSEVARWCGI
jgi:hypothetical protein